MAKNKRSVNIEPPISSQERLIEIMNDSPRVEKFAGTEWEIRALKPGTQWLIAQEAIAISKGESANFEDIIKQFAVNVPSVVKVLTLALLNDRQKIYQNGRSGEYSEEYRATYDTIMWDTSQSEWVALLVEVLSMLDIEVFFSTISLIQILRQRLLERKKTTEEQKQLSRERNGVK